MFPIYIWFLYDEGGIGIESSLLSYTSSLRNILFFNLPNPGTIHFANTHPITIITNTPTIPTTINNFIDAFFMFNSVNTYTGAVC